MGVVLDIFGGDDDEDDWMTGSIGSSSKSPAQPSKKLHPPAGGSSAGGLFDALGGAGEEDEGEGQDLFDGPPAKTRSPSKKKVTFVGAKNLLGNYWHFTLKFSRFKVQYGLKMHFTK